MEMLWKMRIKWAKKGGTGRGNSQEGCAFGGSAQQQQQSEAQHQQQRDASHSTALHPHIRSFKRKTSFDRPQTRGLKNSKKNKDKQSIFKNTTNIW